jgi:serine 3-dehydrogenase (NADP+)
VVYSTPILAFAPSWSAFQITRAGGPRNVIVNNMLVTIENQVVLVVGASSGIGRETAALFAREGARIMASARREERLSELKESLAREGRTVETFGGDAADASQMEHLAQRTRERLGEIDVVVFAAGTNVPDRSMKRLTTKIWDMMVGINLNAAYYVTGAVLPAMRKRGAGHLIYISSVSGLSPDVSGAAYQASKRGLLGLAHAVRVEEKENGIRTCVICPGLVDTEILDRRPVKPSAETLAKALRPEDVAEMVLAVARLPPRVCVPEMQVVPTYL